MKISLDFQIKDLENKDLQGEGFHSGKIIATSLSQSNKGNSIKLHDWAIKFWNKQDVEIDETDKDVLLGFIETCEGITNLVKAQVQKSIKYQAEGKKK